MPGEPPARRKSDLRQRRRDALREQAADAALILFDERGFEQVTVDEIAASIGISPRSFFRYFPTKEDVVLEDPLVYVEPSRDRLETALTTLPLWEALRAAFEAGVVSWARRDPERALRATRVMISTSTLRARNTERNLAWLRALEPLVAGALPLTDRDRHFHAHALTLAALAGLDAALAEWVARDGAQDFGRLLDDVFQLLRPVALDG